MLYTLTQGGQFVTLQHLEAVTFSLVLNFTSIPVALAGILTLHEPLRHGWASHSSERSAQLLLGGVALTAGSGRCWHSSPWAPPRSLLLGRG